MGIGSGNEKFNSNPIVVYRGKDGKGTRPPQSAARAAAEEAFNNLKKVKDKADQN